MIDAVLNLTGNRRKIFWEPEPEPPEPPKVAEIKMQKPKKPANATTLPGPLLPLPPGTCKGNGHKSNKHRELLEKERLYIRNVFDQLNGCLDSKGQVCAGICTYLNKTKETIKAQQKIPGNLEDLSVFQVTGYVSVLHRHVAMGKLVLEDPVEYLKWMKSQYKLWARYVSNKYRKYREKNLSIPGFQPSDKRRYVHGVF